MHRIHTLIGLIVLGLIVAAAGARAAEPPDKRLVNVDRKGVALKGYDPVAYFTAGKPTKGDKAIAASYRGAIYWFSSAQNKQAFEADPAKYEPEFGGYCAYGASVDKLFDIQPDLWSIVDGRLMLQNSRKALGLWEKDVPGNLAKADANWPGLVEKNGK
jgi:YHS domain-containing protein